MSDHRAPPCAHEYDDGTRCGKTREWDGHNPAHPDYCHSVCVHWPPSWSDMFGAFPFMGREVSEPEQQGTK